MRFFELLEWSIFIVIYIQILELDMLRQTDKKIIGFDSIVNYQETYTLL